MNAGGIRLEADAAIDGPRRIPDIGHDDPLHAAVVGGPACRDTEQVGREPATPVLSAGADALIPRSRSASDDAEARGKLPVRERAEERSDVAVRQFALRLHACAYERLVGRGFV